MVEVYDEERGKFITYEVDRLGHALDAETKRPYTMFEEEGKTPDSTVMRAICTIEPHVLKRLKSKAIYSIREEMAMVGESELADHIIFNGKK